MVLRLASDFVSVNTKRSLACFHKHGGMKLWWHLNLSETEGIDFMLSITIILWL
jgi:hypothetical protein